MAVETIYRSTRDPETQFLERKLADAHDAMLELAEGLTEALTRKFPNLDEKHAEDIGIYMAKNKGVFAAAFKNNPSALDDLKTAESTE